MVSVKWTQRSVRVILTLIIPLYTFALANNVYESDDSSDDTPIPSLHPPVLKVKSTEGYLPELSEVGTTVRISPSLHADSLQILVDDADLKPGMPPAIYQYVLTGYGAEKFAVDQRGYLYLNNADIDADTNASTYQLHVQAREVETDPVRSSEPISLTIHIIDVNDNPPTFDSPILTANVSARNSKERKVIKVAATDLDAGKFGRITYRIGQVTGAPYESFRYDEATNELRAVGPLAPGEHYQVLLEAMDGGGLMGKTVILIHALDENFDIYDAAHRGASLGAAAGAVAATAGQSVVSPQPITPIAFSQNQYAQTMMPVPLPIAQQRHIQERPYTRAPPLMPIFTSPALRRTTIEETTEPVQTLVTEISEATPPKAIVAVLGDEETRSKVYFLIADGNEDGKFAIDPDTGVITTIDKFDREQTDVYTLQIEARSRYPDQALYWTILQVAVTDVNDNSPEFLDPQPITLRLNVDDINEFKPNMRIGRLKIRDLDFEDNGHVTLRIMPPMNRLFSISSQGDVQVNGEFTAEHFGEHRLTVIATDHGEPFLEARTTVTVLIGGTLVTQSTLNPNGNTLFTRATLPPPTQAPLSPASFFPQPIPTTAWLPSTAQTKSTYQSMRPSPITKPPSLPTVEPVPAPAPAVTRVAPVFTDPVLNVAVEENEDELDLVTVEAKYPDGQPGQVTYVMMAGDPSLFSVSSFTGTLSLLKPLDAENEQEYVVKIGTAESANLATDSKLAHTVTVTIQVLDVNDWIPNFETNNYAFAVNANTETGTIIGQVAAFDQDRDEPNNKIHYRLANTDGLEKYFAVNAENGLIMLNRDIKEFANEKVTLHIEAEDEGDPPQSTQADVTVDIELNESNLIPKADGSSLLSNPQEGTIQFSLRNYTASISEATRPPHLVQVLSVLNKPQDSRFIVCTINSGNYRGAFSISTGPDGNCELRTQMQLDRESVERYLLNVSVTSNQQTDFSLVSITVLDANDNAPHFIFNNNLDLPMYFAGVSSSASPLTRILVVHAEDADLGNSSLIQYQIDPVSDFKFFAIDESNGEISNKQSMDLIVSRNRRTYFELRVTATDSPVNGQQLSAKADVIINVIQDQHRFATIIKGAQPQNIRSHEEDIIKAIRQYTGLCTYIVLERLDEVSDPSDSVPLIRGIWYAVNPSTKKICKKQEFRKLFDLPTVDMVAGKLKPWFTLQRIQEHNPPSASTGNGGYDNEYAVNSWGWLSNDWETLSTILICCAIGIFIIAILAICAACFYFTKYRQKQSTVYNTHHTAVHQMPKYGAFYLPHGGTMERDKIYETQMLELPISDEDFTMKNSSLRSSTGANRQRRGGRDEPYGRIERDDTTSVGPVHRHPGSNLMNSSRPYGRQHSIHDEGDFSIEESMYAINTPGRMDPVTKYLY